MAENELRKQQFLSLIHSLLSNDSNIRSDAKKSITDMPVEPRAISLWEVIRNSKVNEDIRQMAAVLLKEIFANHFDDLYNRQTPVWQKEYKHRILLGIQFEYDEKIRRTIGGIAVELAKQLMDAEGNNQWTEFLYLLYASAIHSPTYQQTALEIFKSFPGIFGNQQSYYINVIKQILEDLLDDCENQAIRYEAVKSFTAFIIFNRNDENVQAHFLDLTAGMIQIVAESIQKQDDDTLLKCVVDLAENSPQILRRQIQPLLLLCKQAVANRQLRESWRHMALQVIVTLSKTEAAAAAALTEAVINKRAVLLESPNVEFVRKHSGKFLHQNLYGFLTSYVGTSFTTICREEIGVYHAVLTVYGETTSFHNHDVLKVKAEQVLLLRYVNGLCGNRYMTWSFKPGTRFDEYKNRMEIGLAKIGNYHPHVAILQLDKAFQEPAIRCEVTPNRGFPQGTVPRYRCKLEIFPPNTFDRYVEIEEAPQKQEAKVAAYTKMAIQLFKAGVLPPYRPLLSEEKECVVLIKLIKTTEETTIIETSLNSLQVIINVAGDKLRDSICKDILTTVKSLFSKQEHSTRLEAGRCMDSLVRHLPAEDLEALLREASDDDLHEHQALVWTIGEVLSIRLHEQQNN